MRPTSRVGEQHAHLERQLHELAQLRHEVQGLYESTRDQLQTARADASSERQQRLALAAENSSLRKWNAQLSEEIATIVSSLRVDADDSAGDGPGWLGDESSLPRASAELVAQLLRLCGGASDAERRLAQRLAESLLASGPGRGGGARCGDGAAGSSAGGDADALGGCGSLVSWQQLQLELAALSVQHVRLSSALATSLERARRESEHNAALRQGAREMLADLCAATERIAMLETHIGSQADLAAQLREAQRQHAALSHDLEEAEAQVQLAASSVAPAQERAAASESRLDGARRPFAKNGERSAELAAAVRALSEDSRALQRENVQLRLLGKSLGATEAELARPRRREGGVRGPPVAGPPHGARVAGRRRPAEGALETSPAAQEPETVVAPAAEAATPHARRQEARRGASTAVVSGGRAALDEDGEPMYALRTLQERLKVVRSSFAEARELAAQAERS